MKQFLLLACLSVLSLGLTAQVYVDVDATGTGDGSSWANAYPSLNDALIASTAGSSLWIADGTYTTPDSASFFIDKELSLYGGFNGTETAVDAADPDANVTILSGDVNGDDIVGTYDSLNNADNNRVLSITDTSSTGSKYVITIDGLTIANGKVVQDRPTTNPPAIPPFSGGGIRSFSRLALSRVIFTENRADYGSALALFDANGTNTVIDDITVKGNYSGSWSQVYVNRASNLTIRNSEFDGESTVQPAGFISLIVVQNATIDNCTFSNLDIGTDVGAAILAIDCDDVTLVNSTLDGLKSRRGAIFLQQAENFVSTQDEDDFVIENCTFTNCEATQRGAAISSTNTNIKIEDCTFTDLTTEQVGGAIYHLVTDNRTYFERIINTTFDNVTLVGSAGAFGGAIGLLGRSSTFTTILLDGVTFNGSTAIGPDNGGQGGTIYADGNSLFDVRNTTFTKSEAGFGGSIIHRGVAGGTFTNTTFSENGNATGTFQSGGYVAYYDDGAPGTTFDSCTFANNLVSFHGSVISGGTAIYALGGDITQIPLTITNSNFLSNSTIDNTSGGAVYLIGGFDLNIDNCEFNANTTSGQGGAILLDARVVSRDTVGDVITVLRQEMTSSISNSTFIDQNAGTQGGAISTSSVVTDIINCVFINNTLGTGGASGGAVIFNGVRPALDATNPTGFLPVGNVNLEATLAHNTFVDNLKGPSENSVGDNVALYQPDEIGLPDSLSMRVTLLNNVFFSSSNEPSFEAEPDVGSETLPVNGVPVGDLTIVSLGGNFFNGEIGVDFDGVLLATDIVDETISDPALLFVDPFDDEDMGRNLDLNLGGDMLGGDNPLVNGGVANALVPLFDIQGTPRGTTPDIGAYEAFPTSVTQPIENSSLQLEFFPNPTANVLNIRNTDATITTFQVLVSDMTGRVITGAAFNGNVNSLDMTRMPAGVYNLQLIVNGNVYSKQVVKQ
jgi:hypothetical protein